MAALVFVAAMSRSSDVSVAQQVSLVSKLSFYAKLSPPGYYARAPRGTACCRVKGAASASTLAIHRAWTPTGCSGKCNQTGESCQFFSFDPKALLCVLCATCNATRSEGGKEDWRTFGRGDGLGVQTSVIRRGTWSPDYYPSHGIVPSTISEQEGRGWTQRAPRVGVYGGSLGCGGAVFKGVRRTVACDNVARQRRCADEAKRFGRKICLTSCFCRRCSSSCAEVALRWDSIHGAQQVCTCARACVHASVQIRTHTHTHTHTQRRARDPRRRADTTPHEEALILAPCHRPCVCILCMCMCMCIPHPGPFPSSVRVLRLQQQIEAMTTNSQPRFNFAYSPADVDMASVAAEGLVRQCMHLPAGCTRSSTEQGLM